MTRFEGIIRRLLIAVSVFCLLASAICVMGAYNAPKTAGRMEAETAAHRAHYDQCSKDPVAYTADCDSLKYKIEIEERSADSLRQDGRNDAGLAWLWPLGAVLLWLTYFLLRWILTGSVRPVVTRSVGP